jgi:hypothetical protein
MELADADCTVRTMPDKAIEDTPELQHPRRFVPKTVNELRL